MTIQIGIFSTRFKCFKTEFTDKTTLRTFLTIYMDLSQRLTQVGKDPYLLEFSELHQIGAHAQFSPRRTTFLLAPSRTDSPIGRNPREKPLPLSLKKKKKNQPLHPILLSCTFGLLIEEGDDIISYFVSLSLNISKIPYGSLLLDF